jgi:PBP1b-binding outer membrane lipoprotein LpoB
MKFLFLIIIGMVMTGCSQKTTSAEKPQDQKPKTEKSYVGRFQPFKGLAGVALDTMTGKLCKTIDPKDSAGKESAVPSQYESAPLCNTLSNCE